MSRPFCFSSLRFVWIFCGIIFVMAINLKRRIEDGKEKIAIVMDNSHLEYLDNIVEKYDSVKNEAQALDFIIKSVGNNKDRSETIIVDDIAYSPADYDD